jgi:hypothetical protein
MDGDAGILVAESFDDAGKERSYERLVTTDSHLSGGGVRQEVDLANTLPELVEGGGTAARQRAPVERGFDPLRTAVEEANAESVLEIGDRLRDGGLRYGETVRRARHTPPTNHG